MISSMRRQILLLGVFVALVSISLCASDADSEATLRVGIFADLHAHDTDSPIEGLVMTRYRERLQACIDAMNAWPADLMIQLGDFVNGRFVIGAEFGDPARIPMILEDAEAIYAQFSGPRWHVLGNHDIEDLSKEEVLERVNAEWTYGSFDAGAYHFVILDAQYTTQEDDLSHAGWVVQGYVPSFQLDWLRTDLSETSRPTIICVHQRLDVEFDFRTGGPEIANFEEARAILEKSGVVIAVFQGHDHDGAYSLIDGIHYVTFRALIDRKEPTPPSWAMVTLDPVSRTIDIKGEGEQVDLYLKY